jgi:sulfate transport system permease protein
MYLAAILLVPVGLVFWRTFEHGVGPAWDAVTTPDAEHAFWLTLKIAAIAVPLNTVFGVVCALAIVRHRFPGKGVLNAVVDLPLALSPVVVGLSIVLLYGRDGWLGSLPFQVLFATRDGPRDDLRLAAVRRARGRAGAREIGTDQEEPPRHSARARSRRSAASRCRRSAGRRVRRDPDDRARDREYGAVRVVSGNIEGKTQTMTLLVQDSYDNYDITGAYAASVLLAMIALPPCLMTMFRHERRARDLCPQRDQAFGDSSRSTTFRWRSRAAR